MRYLLLLFLFAFVFSGCAVKKKAAATETGISVEKIWDQAPHNAFTDIVRFNEAFYCTFREGGGHVSGPDGKARVLRSADGKKWESVALLEVKDRDVRDPKLSVTPDNRIMVLMDVESHKDGKVISRKPLVSVSDAAGNTFTTPREAAVDPAIASWSDWVWRLTWHNGTGYAILYQPDKIYLVSTKDGSYFDNVSAIPADGSPNECTIRFDKSGKMYVLVRREKGDQVGMIATSDAPYKDWTLKKMDKRLGGPNFIFLDDERLLIGTRQYVPIPGSDKTKHGTVLYITDLNGKINKKIDFPSGGDNSYPGLLVYQDKLWMSYYSSHEGKTSIYLAKIPLTQLQAK